MHPSFSSEFAVLCSGGRPRDPKLLRIFDATSRVPAGLNTRSLHIIGNADIVVVPEFSQLLYNSSRNARVVYHAGGEHPTSSAFPGPPEADSSCTQATSFRRRRCGGSLCAAISRRRTIRKPKRYQRLQRRAIFTFTRLSPHIHYRLNPAGSSHGRPAAS